MSTPDKPERYPAWRFHATEPACIVDDEAADIALGDGWVDSPGKLTAEPEEKKRNHHGKGTPRVQSGGVEDRGAGGRVEGARERDARGHFTKSVPEREESEPSS